MWYKVLTVDQLMYDDTSSEHATTIFNSLLYLSDATPVVLCFLDALVEYEYKLPALENSQLEKRKKYFKCRDPINSEYYPSQLAVSTREERRWSSAIMSALGL